MKKIIVVLFVVVANIAIVYAQTDREVYSSLREMGLQSLQDRKYSDALRQLKGAQGISDTDVIRQDIRRANDSIDVAFSRAEAVFKAGGNASYQRAIGMFSELLDVRKESYAYIGQCYYVIGNTILAMDYYAKGVENNDALSAYWYADRLRRTDPKNTIPKRIMLYKKALQYVGVRDSLGVEYERLNKVDSSYYWYSRSSSAFSKYNRASLLLNPSNKNKLGKIADDPYKLLEEAADSGYAPAAYYLGMLYRYRSRVKGDKDNETGWKWIECAANLGQSEAKKVLFNKNEYVK